MTRQPVEARTVPGHVPRLAVPDALVLDGEAVLWPGGTDPGDEPGVGVPDAVLGDGPGERRRVQHQPQARLLR